MNSHSTAPSSGRGRTTRNAATRSGGISIMSERQAQAYLLARDAVRRIQRTASLAGASAPWAAGITTRQPGAQQHQRH